MKFDILDFFLQMPKTLLKLYPFQETQNVQAEASPSIATVPDVSSVPDVPEASDETTSDHLLALMLQRQYDKEHDEELRARERAYNRNDKGF